jgi:hypothetical protein
MGTAMAFREQTTPVPGTPNDTAELLDELRECAVRINARNRLHAIVDTIRTLEEPSAGSSKAHFFLLELNPQTLKVTGFTAKQQQEAQQRYTDVERRIAKEANSDAVLVSVDSFASLRRAYPNYFLDTSVFARLLDDALEGRLLDPALV